MQNPFFKSIINRCVPVGQLKLLHTQPCVYTCVPYELQKSLESGMAAGGAWERTRVGRDDPARRLSGVAGTGGAGRRGCRPLQHIFRGQIPNGQTRVCGFDGRPWPYVYRPGHSHIKCACPNQARGGQQVGGRPNPRYLAVCTDEAPSRCEQRGWTEARDTNQEGPQARMFVSRVGGKPRVANRRGVTIPVIFIGGKHACKSPTLSRIC